jgi:hypothetical protein
MLDDEWAHARQTAAGCQAGDGSTRLGRLPGYSVRKRWEELCPWQVEADIEELSGAF